MWFAQLATGTESRFKFSWLVAFCLGYGLAIMFPSCRSVPGSSSLLASLEEASRQLQVAGGSTVFHVDPPTEVSADCQRAFAVTLAQIVCHSS
jgi:hypothetical protein